MIWRIIGIGGVWTATWWLIIGALAAPVLPGGWITIAILIAALIVPLLIWSRRFSGSYPSAFVRRWVFRPFWYGQLLAPVAALAGIAGTIVGLPFGAPIFAGRLALAIMVAIFAIVTVTGYVGSRRLRVKQLEVRLPTVPSAFDGMRIVQISDLHVGPHTPRRHLAAVAAAVRDASPDVIAITGDQVDDYGRDVEHFAAAFGGLKARDGVFAIPGNHDIYAGWSEVHDGLAGMGITVMVNDAIAITRGTARLWIVGTGDPAAAGPGWHGKDAAPDLDRCFQAVPPDAFTIALAHNPVLWPPLAARGVSLTLSGHTHYGQLSIPSMNWSLASVFLEHAMEWYRRGESLLYINPGTNYWGLPLRIGALPEVTVLTLRASEECAIADVTPATRSRCRRPANASLSPSA